MERTPPRRADPSRASGGAPPTSSAGDARATEARAGSKPDAWRLALVVTAACVLVWHRALLYFFSQDDFAKLGSVVGLAPRLEGPWRWVGNQLIWDLLHAVAGLDPRPYHAASIACHIGCSLLLLARLQRRVSPPAALAASVFFAVHPALFGAVYWVSVIADSLSLLFALAALALAEMPGRRRWLAVPLFVFSLLSKESTLLLPVVLLLARRPEEPAARGARSDPLVLALGGVAAIYLVYFVTSAYPTYFQPGGPAVPSGSPPPRTAYGLGLGGHVFANFLTLTGWAANFTLPTVRGFSDAVDAAVYPWAIGATLLWLAGLGSSTLRRKGWLEGGVIYLAFLLPLLPLAHHTYHYYLYAPLAGVAICFAAALELAGERLPWPRPLAPRLASLLACGLLAWNGYALVLKIETEPFLRAELRSEPIIDRALIARRAYQDLRDANLPAGTRLMFWSPSSIALARETARDSASAAFESYWERNVRHALVDGLAVRILLPQVDSVAFVREYRSLPEPYRYAVYRLDGSLKAAASTELDSVVSRYPVAR